jgi:hypothetical protein
MAYTDFLKPTTVTQTTGATEIAWDLDTSPYNTSTGSGSAEPLSSFNSKTTGLLLYSGFRTSIIPSTSDGFTTTLIDGIEVKILSDKEARIKDTIIQLAQSGSVIGSNKANTNAGNIYTYGGSADTWGTSLTYNDLSSLQVALKYSSGTIPHRDSVYVYSVQLKIYYT